MSKPIQKYGKKQEVSCKQFIIRAFSETTGLFFIDNENRFFVLFDGNILNKDSLIKKIGVETNNSAELFFHVFKNNELLAVEGPFVFVVYDSKEKTIYLGRDAIGLRNLYFFKSQKGLAFASSIKSILKNPHFKPTLNKRVLYENSKSIFLPWNENIFQGMKAIKPGTITSFKNNTKKEISYYRIALQPKRKISKQEAIKQGIDLMSGSLKKQFNLSKSTCLGLSGIDSTVLAKIASDTNYNFSTITCADNESSQDIIKGAEIAKLFEIPHHERILDSDKVLSQLPFNLHEGETLHGLYHQIIIKESKKYCNQLIMGDGADRLFALDVYKDFYAFLLKQKRIHNLPTEEGRKELSKTTKGTRFCYFADHERYIPKINEFDSFKQSRNYLKRETKRNPLSRHYVFLNDFVATTAGISLGLPYLDRDFVEFINKTSEKFKVGNNDSKRLISMIAKKLGVPKKIIYRKKLGSPANFKKTRALAEAYINIKKEKKNPLSKYLLDKPWEYFKFKLYHYIFFENRGKLPKNFSFTDIF